MHDATCGHLREAVAKAEGATVPGAVRAVLASEVAGLLPRQVIEGVKLLRPETDDESVHGALHALFDLKEADHLLDVSDLDARIRPLAMGPER